MYSGKEQTEKGFTLIELLVVIAIIAIISVIGMTQLAKAREKARDSKRRLNMGELQHQLTSYYDDHNGVFPKVAGDTSGATVEPDHSATQRPSNATGIYANGGKLIPDYIRDEMTDPMLGEGGHEYFYIANCETADCSADTGATDYMLYTLLEAGDVWYAVGPSGKISDVGNMFTIAPTCPGVAATATDACTAPSA